MTVIHASTVKQPFEAVVARHGQTVLRVCRAVLGSSDADDAWSETFLAALRAYPDLPDDANVEAWLVTIAHHKAIDVTRATSRRAIPIGELTDTPVAGTGAPADHRREQDEPELWEAFADLSPKQRAAVAYHHVAGLPYRDVAEIVGGSTEAARRAAADGIAALRRTFPGRAARRTDSTPSTSPGPTAGAEGATR